MRTGAGTTQPGSANTSGAAATGGTPEAGTTAGPVAGEGSSLLGGTPAAPGTEGKGAQGAGTQTTEQKPGEGEKPKEGQPAPAADVELKLPDGFAKDDPLVAEFTKSAKELGLKSEGAQKIFDLYAKAQADSAAKTQAALEKQTKQWVDAVKADPEIGGDKLQASLVAANKAVFQFGGKELHELLDATGLGNHPVVVKAFAKIGQGVAEDNSGGATGGGGTPDRSARLRARYPSMFQNKE